MITPRIVSRECCASGKRFSTSTPTPSPGTNPSALLSKLRQRPCGDNIPAAHIPMYASGVRYSVTPPTTATSISPLRSA